MRRNKIKFESLNSDEKQQQLANLKDTILQCKEDIVRNTVNLGMYLYCAKEQVSHGEWGKWLADNVDFTERTASRFMKVYKTTIELDGKYDEAIGNLNSSQLIEISALKKTDVENLLDTKNVKDMSVRELQQVIKDMKVKNKPKKSKSDNVVLNETETQSIIADTPKALAIQSDITEIWDSTVKLNKELHMRVNSDEDLETTLVARYSAKEIMHQNFIDIVAQQKLNLPIFFYKEALDDYLERKDFYSDYEHWGDKEKYYSLFIKEFEWQEAIKCYNKKDEDAIDWSKNNHRDNGMYQLSNTSDDNGYMNLCIYKDYKLLGAYQEGNTDDIKALCNYDIDLDYKQLEALYNKLQDQLRAYDERNIIRQDKQAKEREKRQKQQKKYNEVLENWKTYYQPYSMGKYKFEDIWNEKGDIKDYKLWNEMTTFCSKQRSRKYDSSWKDYDFSKMFGGSSAVAVKEEDKPTYKQFYRKLAMEFHPDKCKDDGHAMQLINDLKSNWGI